MLCPHFDLPPSEGCVYQGGPVEQTALFILHNSQALDPDETPVIEDLLIGSCAEVFENVVRESIEDPSIEFRVFSGCSGWGAGQLEGELDRGDWFVVPASLDYVFAKDPYAVWENLMEQVHKSSPNTAGSSVESRVELTGSPSLAPCDISRKLDLMPLPAIELPAIPGGWGVSCLKLWEAVRSVAAAEARCVSG